MSGIGGMHALTGKPLSGLEHIRQSIGKILTTPIGSRLARRTFGSEVPELIDQPANGATVLRIYAATAHAVGLWEPRIQLTGVLLERDGTGATTLVLDGYAGGTLARIPVPVHP